MLLSTLALLNLTLSFPHTTEFLRTLLADEKPDYVNIIKIGNCSTFHELLSTFDLPKTITDTNNLEISFENGYHRLIGFNFLNFPQYDKILTLKYYFKRSFLSVIFVDKISPNLVIHIEWLLLFSRLSTVVIISNNEGDQLLESVMEALHSKNFINVLYLNVGRFEEEQLFTTYDSFPGFKLASRQTFDKQEINNIMKKEVSVGLIESQPYCIYDREKKDASGIMVHFYKNFVQFVNGTFLRKMYGKLETGHSLIGHDFAITLPFMPLSFYKDLYPVSMEICSDDIDFTDLILIIPKAKPMKKELYLVKIFSIDIWILTLTVVFFASGCFAMYEMITRQRVTFWRTFGQVFRSSLGQSFPWPSTIHSSSIFFLMCLLFGFILTLWFNAILGSFVTSTLYDKQPKSVEDLRRQNIKIQISTQYNPHLFKNFKELEDLAVYGEYRKDQENASLILGHTLNLLRNTKYARETSNMSYIQSDFVVERSFLRSFLKIDSFYKDKVNRFIGLIKDRGLFQRWCDLANKEFSDTQDYKPRSVQDSSIQVLQLEFFLYPFCVWAMGLFLSCIVFLFEIYRINIFSVWHLVQGHN